VKPARVPVKEITVAESAFIADSEGALFWPSQRILVVADLHLEKGSSFAARGVLLPPHDSAATLALLGRVIDRYAPNAVIALGDSFHDAHGPSRMAPQDSAALARLQRGREWLWLLGNHDPGRTDAVGGSFADALAIGPLVFRHMPTGTEGEIAGHLHPLARVNACGRMVVRRCFVCDGARLVMPAFGAYAGGLSVRDRAFSRVFAGRDFSAHLLGAGRVYSLPASRCA
jgi:DNA ligase-associated metallophosphoesterase